MNIKFPRMMYIRCPNLHDLILKLSTDEKIVHKIKNIVKRSNKNKGRI